MQKIFILLFSFISFITLAQTPANHKSIHREQWEEYNAAGKDGDYYEKNNKASVVHNASKSNACTLTKKVYGWHPYWNNGYEANYQWDKLSHLCYFSYDVSASTGNATSTHSWSTAAVVTTALAQGVKVHLCATLFSNHSTFWASSTAQQTFITNIINLIQTRGAHGVNIDFEGMGSSDKTPFTNFMISLCNQMHTANPNYEVTIAGYSVDWSGVFDMAVLKDYIDYFVIMGYDYYYGGSSTAGPTSPTYSLTTSYNYNISKSITYYLGQGCPANKLLLGLPYYGREWPVSSTTPPSATTGSGQTVLFKTMKTNASGDYNTRLWENNCFSPYYNYGGNQCFIDDGYSFGKKLDIVNIRGIGGIGIWALGYDDGYTDLWDKISDKLSTCKTVACSDTIYDGGGPTRNYYDKEKYTYTISPDNASSVTLNFTSFNTEQGYDSLYIYDGANTNAALIGAYTGTNSPGTITSTGPSITLKFKADNSTTATGFSAIWNCNIDNTLPTTSVSVPSGWITNNFTANFTDADAGSGVEKSFYQVIDYNGYEWRANNTRGFFSDNFDGPAIHPDWTSMTGTWSINANGYLQQSDESLTNTNIYAPLTQNLSNRYLYHWAGQISGTGTNRRAGFHFFCDQPDSSNRGNSYFVWFRLDNDKIQIYETSNNSFGSPVADVAYDFTAGQMYDFKVTYDRVSGIIKVYINDVLSATWTDTTPLSNGNYISFRSGNCKWEVNNLKVYRSRYPSVTVNVGTAANADIRYENQDPSTPSGRIKSIVTDNVGNLSAIASQDVNIDWTSPQMGGINDGTSNDIDTVYNTNNTLSANWFGCADTNSLITEYFYSVGTSPGATDIMTWTSTGTNTAITTPTLSLTVNQMYYFNIYSVDGAGLVSDTISSNGQLLLSPLGIKTNGMTSIRTVPNPFGNNLTIEFNSSESSPVIIKMVDVSGKEVFTQVFKTNQSGMQKLSINTENLASGVYFIQINNQEKTSTIKAIKQ